MECFFTKWLFMARSHIAESVSSTRLIKCKNLFYCYLGELWVPNRSVIWLIQTDPPPLKNPPTPKNEIHVKRVRKWYKWSTIPKCSTLSKLKEILSHSKIYRWYSLYIIRNLSIQTIVRLIAVSNITLSILCIHQK